jgi:hypothetical protein
MSDRRIKELAEIEFKGSLEEAFGMYADELQKLSRRLVFELEMAANDSRAAMSRLHGHWWLLGLDAKVQARIVAKRLTRAQEQAAGLAVEARAFKTAYRRQFIAAKKGR